MKIGERIKELRNEKKITQKELSQMTNIAQSTISGWEKNLFEPTASAIKILCIVFDVSADYLLGLEDETGAKTCIANSFNNFSNNGTFKI